MRIGYVRPFASTFTSCPRCRPSARRCVAEGDLTRAGRGPAASRVRNPLPCSGSKADRGHYAAVAAAGRGDADLAVVAPAYSVRPLTCASQFLAHAPGRTRPQVQLLGPVLPVQVRCADQREEAGAEDHRRRHRCDRHRRPTRALRTGTAVRPWPARTPSAPQGCPAPNGQAERRAQPGGTYGRDRLGQPERALGPARGRRAPGSTPGRGATAMRMNPARGWARVYLHPGWPRRPAGRWHHRRRRDGDPHGRTTAPAAVTTVTLASDSAASRDLGMPRRAQDGIRRVEDELAAQQRPMMATRSGPRARRNRQRGRFRPDRPLRRRRTRARWTTGRSPPGTARRGRRPARERGGVGVGRSTT